MRASGALLLLLLAAAADESLLRASKVERTKKPVARWWA